MSSPSAQQQAEDTRAVARQHEEAASAMGQPLSHSSHDAPLTAASASSSASVASTVADQSSSPIQADGELQTTAADVDASLQSQQAAADASIEPPAGVPSAALLPRFSLAQRCHNDALHCIFAFLKLQGMVALVQTCRAWRHAASTEPSRHLRCSREPDDISALVGQLAQRHISRVAILVPCTLQQLAPLRSLPQLMEINASLHGASLLMLSVSMTRADAAAAVAASLPHCTSFDVSVSWPGEWSGFPVTRINSTTRAHQTLLDGLASTSRGQRISLLLPRTVLDLRPLQCMDTLRSLHLLGRELTSAEADVVSQLSGLIELSVKDQLSVSFLQRLCRDGHPQLLHLHSLPGGYRTDLLGAEHVRLLAHFPELRQLPGSKFTLDALPLLASCLPNLTAAHMHIISSSATASVASIVQQLSACRAVTSMVWCASNLSTADLAALADCKLLTQLSIGEIRLESEDALGMLSRCPSLDFLQVEGLRAPAESPAIDNPLAGHQAMAARVRCVQALASVSSLRVLYLPRDMQPYEDQLRAALMQLPLMRFNF